MPFPLKGPEGRFRGESGGKCRELCKGQFSAAWALEKKAFNSCVRGSPGFCARFSLVLGCLGLFGEVLPGLLF